MVQLSLGSMEKPACEEAGWPGKVSLMGSIRVAGQPQTELQRKPGRGEGMAKTQQNHKLGGRQSRLKAGWAKVGKRRAQHGRSRESVEVLGVLRYCEA